MMFFMPYVLTDQSDDYVNETLKISEGRWQIEEYFRIMKTDFSARPIYLQNKNRIKASAIIKSVVDIAKANIITFI